MKKRTFLVFTTYIWTKTLLGLTFHPFLSIRGILRRPILLPVIFSPIIGLLFFFVLGRIGALILSFHGVSRELLAMFLSTMLLSILLWQGLLIYLLVSFFSALRRE